MNTAPNVFISWSGDRSQCVAEALRSWLPYVIESPSYWISSRDLPDGRRWVVELSERLEASHFGVLVVTPENSSSAWLMFEAGALSKSIQQGKVVPYLVAVNKKALTGPLGQFQALLANKEGTQRLVESIRASVPKPPEKVVIQKRFELFWPELERKLAEIVGKRQPDSPEASASKEGKDDIAVLRGELAETTSLIRQLVSNWTPAPPASGKAAPQPPPKELHSLEGSWHDDDSFLYTRVINGQLVAPYCYNGNNKLTAEYYDWKKVGDYWFTRYRWFEGGIEGFSFYKLESPDKLVGMWWYDEDAPERISSFEELDGKTRSSGYPATWRRMESLRPPKWAQDYFKAAKESVGQGKPG